VKYYAETPLNNDYTLKGQGCKACPVRRWVPVGREGGMKRIKEDEYG
jgi:hypothetical protein